MGMGIGYHLGDRNSLDIRCFCCCRCCQRAKALTLDEARGVRIFILLTVCVCVCVCCIVVLIFNCCQRFLSRALIVCQAMPGPTMRAATDNCNVKLSISIVCPPRDRDSDSDWEIERDRERVREIEQSIHRLSSTIIELSFFSLIAA